MSNMETDFSLLWQQLRAKAAELESVEPLLAAYLRRTVLERASLAEAISCLLADKLADDSLVACDLAALFADVYDASPTIGEATCRDLAATIDRDPASHGGLNPFLNYKGFHALQAYRISHWLWAENRMALAFWLQGRISEVFAVDIHPAARVGAGVFIDHGTGVVIGETAVVEDDVSILQNVTLGGTGKVCGDRHPKIGKGVLIGAGATVLGNIRVGEGAKIGAGSVVLQAVQPHTTVVGVPARPVGHPRTLEPALAMDQDFDDDTASQ